MKLNLFNLELNKIDTSKLFQEILEKIKKQAPAYLCAVNVHMTIESRKDSVLLKAINNADWAVTDGTPVSWAFSFFNGVKQERIAGMDLTPMLIKLANDNNLVISVYGNTTKNLELFEIYVRENYPSLKLGELISPPYRVLSKEESQSYIDAIKAVGTNILFVSLGCPKQEKWMFENSHKINGVCLGIGNAINTTIGTEKRPPQFIQKIGFEWFYRLVQNPKRLFRRYFITNTMFCWLVIKNIFSIK